MRVLDRIKDNWCENCGSSKLACSKCKLNPPSNWTAKQTTGVNEKLKANGSIMIIDIYDESFSDKHIAEIEKGKAILEAGIDWEKVIKDLSIAHYEAAWKMVHGHPKIQKLLNDKVISIEQLKKAFDITWKQSKGER